MFVKHTTLRTLHMSSHVEYQKSSSICLFDDLADLTAQISINETTLAIKLIIFRKVSKQVGASVADKNAV